MPPCAAPVTYGLIALCCLVFLIGPASGLNPAYGAGDALAGRAARPTSPLGRDPRRALRRRSAGAALTPVTALFVHGSWVHLLGNMLFLYVFGAMTEEPHGPRRFTLFYLGCGYLALLGYAAAHAESDAVPGRRLRGDLRGARRVPVPVPRGAGHQPPPLPLLPAAALPRLGRAALLGGPAVAGGGAGAQRARAWPIWRTWSASASGSSTRGRASASGGSPGAARKGGGGDGRATRVKPAPAPAPEGENQP